MRTVGEPFPAFRLQAVIGTPPQFQDIDEHTYPGKWKVIFFWPMDFTFVCPTEIAAFGRRTGDFHQHDAQVLGVGTDGRSVDETLRGLAALQTDGLTPCNWQPGDPTLRAA